MKTTSKPNGSMEYNEGYYDGKNDAESKRLPRWRIKQDELFCLPQLKKEYCVGYCIGYVDNH